MTEIETEPTRKMFNLPSRGADYNLEAGLDWDRINAEYQANVSAEERETAKAAAKAIQQGQSAANRKKAVEAVTSGDSSEK